MKLLKQLTRAALLVIDDFGLVAVTGKQYRDLLEILDDRHGQGATLITSQFPVSQWHELINDATVADAILDRLVHNAYRLELKGESIAQDQGQPRLQRPESCGLSRRRAPWGGRPQTRPPPNGTQAHDLSRELWFGRPAPVGATPFGDGLVCSIQGSGGRPHPFRGTRRFAPKKRPGESRKNLTQFGHPSISHSRASLRSDNCPKIPDHCPTISDWVSEFIGIRIICAAMATSQRFRTDPAKG